MEMRFLGTALLFFLFGCGTTPLTEMGSKVRFANADPIGCMPLGVVEARDIWWGSQVTVENKLRNQASELGANIAVIDLYDDWGQRRTSAFIYKCDLAKCGY